MPHTSRCLLGLTITAATLTACGGPPPGNSAETAIVDDTANLGDPSTFVYLVRASISEERLVAASIRSVVGAARRDEVATVYLVEGTAAGTAPLATFDALGSRNRYAREGEVADQAQAANETISTALSANERPEPGRVVDLAQTTVTAVGRAEARATDRRPFVVIITTALVPGDPLGPLELPAPRAGLGAEVVIVGAGDFGGLEDHVDPHLSAAAERYAREVCAAVERTPDRSCRVQPSLDADPTRELSA